MIDHVWQTQLTATPSSPLPAVDVAEVKERARFTSPSLDAEWSRLVFKATARLEMLIGKTFRQRQFTYSLWQDKDWQSHDGCLLVPLPRGPIVRAEARLAGATKPSVLLPDGTLRVCELPSSVAAFEILEMSYLAGMGADTSDIPADIRSFVSDTAVFYFQTHGYNTSATAEGSEQHAVRAGLPRMVYEGLAGYRESVPPIVRMR